MLWSLLAPRVGCDRMQQQQQQDASALRMSPLGPPPAAVIDDEAMIVPEPAKNHHSEDESDEDDPKRLHHDEDEVEVDVLCSNPNSPVDLSRPGQPSFVHPLARHAFTCLSNGLPGTIVPGLINGGPLGYHAPPPTAALMQPVGLVGAPGKSVTTTAGAGGKRGLAFSVENILDPNKFTGGRIVHPRIRGRRRRSSSVIEGNIFLRFLLTLDGNDWFMVK